MTTNKVLVSTATNRAGTKAFGESEEEDYVDGLHLFLETLFSENVMPPFDGASSGATLNIKRGIAAPFIYLLSKGRATPRHCHHKYFKTFFNSSPSRPAQINAIPFSTDGWMVKTSTK